MDLLVEGPLAGLKPCNVSLPVAVKIPSRYHSAAPFNRTTTFYESGDNLLLRRPEDSSRAERCEDALNESYRQSGLRKYDGSKRVPVIPTLTTQLPSTVSFSS